MKKVTTPFQITAADSDSRTITGTIVTFEETGNASIGKVQFAKGSIEPTPVLLNLEHDRSRRIGKTLSIESNDQNMTATFKIAATTAGNDALVEAAEGLRDGFSVEVAFDEYETLKDGTVRILKGELTAVALTSEPAIRSARVESVAATEEEISDSTIEPEAPQPTEGEDEVEDTVKDAATAETVEAAQSITATANAVGGWKSTPRIEITAAKYLENKVLAATGDESARQYVLAADNTTDNAGLVPTRQLTEVINGLGTRIRPSIDAISSGSLPDAGMTFEIPKITQMPTVAETAEDAAFSNTDQNSAFLSVDVKKFAGQQKFSVELLTRTSPLFYDELLRNMVAAMAKAQNSYVNGILISNASLDATTVATYPTAAELLGIIGRGAASVYGATAGLANPFARNLIASTGQWSNLMTLNDAGRPIYSAVSQPSNQPGSALPTSLTGNVAGLNLYVDPTNGGDGDGTLLVVNPDAYTWYEGTSYQLRAESTADGSITVGVYSFGAVATKIAAGAFQNNKA